MFALLLLVSAQTAADDARWGQLHDRIQAAPHSVATFIERRTSCNHWDGEVFGDHSEREQFVEAQRGKLRCNDIERDERALRLKYHRRAEVLQLLEDTKDLPPW